MSISIRHEIINELQAERKSLVISYVTSTRANCETSIEMDAVRKIYNHILSNNANREDTNIDLFLHSNGGNGIVPWRLITLLREYCKKLSVIIPHRAFSAATLIALGADEIIMHPMGMMGPVDPTVSGMFNPTNPRNPSQILGISVEDVSSYVTLVKEDVGIRHEDELVKAFNVLADKVHPLALGSVKRFMVQSRMMAKKLLELHMTKSSDEHKINEIVEILTSKLYYHGHPINREEAASLGLKVINPDSKIESIIWRLYQEYETEMMLDQPFKPFDEHLFGQHNGSQPLPEKGSFTTQKLKTIYIESIKRTDVFTSVLRINYMQSSSLTYQVNAIPLQQIWEVET